MHDTIWIPPRATVFTAVCEACEEELPDARPRATVSGSLGREESEGWATCLSGHNLRVLRMGVAVPAGALR